jgi:hypothetical protein
MRLLVPILAAVMTVVGEASQNAEACGDKFLLVGRGPRFHRAYAAIYPASIVIYAHARRNASSAIRDPRFQTDLKLAGHRVLLAEDETALARALESDHVDFVLTDVVDAEQISKQAATSPSNPAVLPVMYQPTREEAQTIEAKYMCLLKASDRADRYLTTIDDAMKARVGLKKKKIS